jgi:hypothetical protein
MECPICRDRERAYQAGLSEYTEARSSAYYQVSKRLAAFKNVEMARAKSDLEEHRLVCVSAIRVLALLPERKEIPDKSTSETMDRGPFQTIRAIVAVLLLIASGVVAARARSPDQATIIRQIDAAVAARVDNILGFTDVEHYSVYRDGDETHPVAEMTVRDIYKKGVGKEYTVLSQSGSGIILRFGLMPLIDNEKTINLPGNVQKSWFNSANYEMKEKPGGMQRLNGRDCYVLAISPKRGAPNLIVGTLWADAKDGSLVQIEGVASKSPNAFAGTTHMLRQYANTSGFAMALYARAESTSMLFGRTVVTIDYSDYHLQLRENK